MNETLLIRADASPLIGTGHVMRCLALAEPWLKAGAAVTFVSAELPMELAKRVQGSGVKLHSLSAKPGSEADANEFAQFAARRKADWLVVDGYHFDADYQRALKRAGQRVLFFDDFGHAKFYSADFVLNQNLGASENLYRNREPETQLLLGTRFVQLRGEFSRWHDWQRTVPPRAHKILATLGGSDAENVTLKVIEAVGQFPDMDLETTVVIGGSNPHAEGLKSLITHYASRMRLNQNAEDMPELMAHADLAIAAGGTTAWELAFMGLPALMMVMAENQRSNAEQLQSDGIAQNLGWHKELSPEKIAAEMVRLAGDFRARSAMSKRGRQLVDGRGSFRVWLHLNERRLRLRRATPEDARRIWEWANEPAVRAVSFSPENILRDEHDAWLAAKLADPNCVFWIADDAAGIPAGMIRFDLRDGTAVVSVSLDKSERGKNLGALLIWSACRKLFRESAAAEVNACIKPDNQASIRAFQKAGFEQTSRIMVKGQPALRFRLKHDGNEM